VPFLVSLEEYQKKRRFEGTPEPKGLARRRRGALRFVVQKHRATRMHYDFRLELDGVLKSWAVPKGPSLKPGDKRLAIMVEDHPLEYRTFEGIIPQGNYGAGTVMVWDEGTYGPPKTVDDASFPEAMRAGFAKGHLRFTLFGRKLRGEFSLIKLKHGEKNGWLFLKHTDEFGSDADVLEQDRSALSGRTMDEIAASAPRRGQVWHSSKPAARAAKRRLPPVAGAPRAPMPHRIKPMLATLADEPFDRPGWFFEVKWDGYRAVAEVEKGVVKLYSRKLVSYDTKFPAIVNALTGLGHDAVLDGEVCALDEQGKSSFELLQNYQKARRGSLVYYVFDLLYLDGQDLRNLPLSRRKELLAVLIRGRPLLQLSEHIVENGTAFFKAVLEHGLEGMIAKKADSVYVEDTRSSKWLKLKTRSQQEVVIGGFTEPRGSRQGLGALVIGTFEGNRLVYCGHAGGGFSDKGLADMRARLEPLLQKACPFEEKPKTNAPVHWVKPALVCEVAFQQWTEDGSMRQPIFLRLREDVPPESVKREVAKPAPVSVKRPSPASPPRPAASDDKPTSPAQGPLQARVNTGPLPAGNYSNLGKIYWPEDGYTKGDLLAYYHEVGPFIVPYLRDRPLSMNRHPNGIHSPNFFQKDVKKQPPPAWVHTEDVPSESRGSIRHLICDDEPTLLYVANLGCIEMNPWHSRLGSINNPDYLILDLDPPGVPFTQVVEAAQVIRRTLEKGCGASFCKTSGKRGLHIYVPLGKRYDYDQARRFAELIARLCHHQLPATTSVVRDPAQRKHQIYVDFLQNRRGQTIASAYSARPSVGAMVSTPLDWREVNKKLDPRQFTIKTVPRRLEKKGDLWQPVLGPGFDLAACVRSLEKSAGPKNAS
jgi:bifunctional non-homologous end joining protein LigD